MYVMHNTPHVPFGWGVWGVKQVPETFAADEPL
jgi:hypothetical protein